VDLDAGFVVRLAVAVGAGLLIVRVGVALMRGMAQPPPEPDEGELRRVSLRYRCSICGAEIKMTLAPGADPDPPRHCQEDMDLVAPVE